MGRYNVTPGGPEWRKWCATADESRFTRRFVRGQSRERKRSFVDEPDVDVLATYDWCDFYEVSVLDKSGRLRLEWAEDNYSTR
jgi:hypothetical protein